MDYLIGTLQSHDLEHCECTGHFLHWGHCNEIGWEILNVLAIYRMGMGWVLYPFPCNVLAMSQPGTPPLVPSDTNLSCSDSDWAVPHKEATVGGGESQSGRCLA